MARRRKKKVNPEGVAKRIVPAKDADPYVKILVYAKNGIGKTRFCATAPKVLIIDINEKGTRSVRRSDAQVFQARDWVDVESAYWYLKRGDHGFESVALDTITAMSAVCMSRILYEKHERNPDEDPKQPRRQDWFKLKELMGDMLLRYRNLPMHMILTAQERTEGDPEEGEPLFHAPDLPGGARGVAMGSVEVIGRMYRREVKPKKKGKGRSKWETRMLVGDHEDYETKDRTLVLPRVIREPTVPKIMKAAFDEEEE